MHWFGYVLCYLVLHLAVFSLCRSNPATSLLPTTLQLPPVYDHLWYWSTLIWTLAIQITFQTYFKSWYTTFLLKFYMYFIMKAQYRKHWGALYHHVSYKKIRFIVMIHSTMLSKITIELKQYPPLYTYVGTESCSFI